MILEPESLAAGCSFSKLAIVLASTWNLELPDATFARIEVRQVETFLTAGLLDVNELTEAGFVIASRNCYCGPFIDTLRGECLAQEGAGWDVGIEPTEIVAFVASVLVPNFDGTESCSEGMFDPESYRGAVRGIDNKVLDAIIPSGALSIDLFKLLLNNTTACWRLCIASSDSDRARRLARCGCRLCGS